MRRTQNNALGAVGAAAEGDIETPEEERYDMSNSTANALLRPPVIERRIHQQSGLLVYLDDGEPTIAEVDWAQQNLVGLPVKVLFSDREVVHWTNGTAWFRSAGSVRVVPGSAFEIHLRRGATTKDLTWLRELIDRACGGKFASFGWTREGDSAEYQCNLVPRIAGEGDVRFQANADQIVPCVDPNCTAAYHDEAPDLIAHVADRATAKDYTVTVERFEDSEWQLSIDMNDPDLSPAAAISLANDLQYLAATCRQLNDRKAEAA